MNTNTFINKFLDTGSTLAHQASLKWWHIGRGLLGSVLLLLIGLEYIASLSTVEMMTRDIDGNLPVGSGLKITIGALLFCGTTLALFHLPVGRLRKSITMRMLFWIMLATSAMTLSQPIISLISEMHFGNSLDGGADGGLILKQQLITVGYTVRAFVILGAAFAASWGLHMVFDAIRGVAGASRAGKDSAEVYEGINEADRLHQKAVTSRERSIHFNWDRSEAFAAAVAEGFVGMANTVARYLKGPDDPFIDPEQVMVDMIAQFDEPITPPEDPKIARMVSMRLKKHAIDLTLLPSSSAQLTKAARKQMAHYADWLRAHADIDLIHETIRYEMET